MDFAAALKYTLRQDPDIILVGEIRDGETASTSIDAGLTGHLVLSTLHTNNAASALTRLIDLGVRPFLLPGVIRLIIAQRLVRELCDCKEVYNPNTELKKEIIEKISKYPEFKNLIEKDFQLYKPKGCSKCNSTGFVGRIPIAESIKPSASIEELVINKNSTSKIYEQALKDGMIPMEIDGLIKAVQGKTTVEEVWRVTRE
jgi:type II secretory ATPase GspE/PulE/Tfp pilus assembly ATPase PilB-like protein